MKKMMMCVTLVLIAVNAALFLAALSIGKPFSFHLVPNVVAPVLAALVGLAETQQTAGML